MGRKPNDVAGVFEKVPGSGIWYLRYRQAGKQVKKKIGTRAEAVAELDRIKLAKRTGGKVATSAKERTLTPEEIDAIEQAKVGGVTIEEVCNNYLDWLNHPSNKRRPRDMKNPPIRLRNIVNGLGNRIAETVLPIEIDAWFGSLGKKAATLNRYRSTLSKAYKHAIATGKIKVNPIREVAAYAVDEENIRYLLPREEKRLRAVLDRWINECPVHHRLKKLYLRCHPIELTLALCTGLRKGNLYRLRWDDHVDLEERTFRLPASMMKNKTGLNLPMIQDAYDALVELKGIHDEIESLRQASHPEESEPQRMVADGRIFHISENREWWSDALDEAGIKDLRWHDLRHSFATRLLAAGVDIRVVQMACAHKSIAMTAKYAKVADDLLRSSMSRLNKGWSEATIESEG